MLKNTSFPRFVIAAVVVVCLSGLMSSSASAQETPNWAAMGQLKIVGKGIEHLVLVDKDNKRHEFSNPDEVLSLPAGVYRPEQVRLKGGFSCNTYSHATGYNFKIDPNGTAELKMGAPLTQTLTINRKGKILQLGYELRGIGGEEYTPNNRSNPPEFAVYKGDTKVGGGKFEFG